MISKHQIVYQLYPKTVRTEAETTATSSLKAFDKDDKEISLDASAIDAEFAKQEYKNKRADEYPSVVDQLDKIYHSGVDAWKADIKAIKDKYPKS